MKNDHRILVIVAALVAVALAFFFLQDDDTVHLGSRDYTDAQDDAAADSEPEFRPRRSADGATSETESAPAAPEADSDHVPDHGPLLFTATAQAEFEIVDGRQQPLPKDLKVYAQLNRLVNGMRIRERARVDMERGRIVCAGAADGGLEPGHYLMSLRAGAYGALWHEFHLAPGQRLVDRIVLPNWSRVIRLRFVDGEGRGLPRLSVKPSYRVADARLEERNFAERPGIILREPPSPPSEPGAIGMGGGGATGARRGNLAYLTADGSWYLLVVAGCEGTVRVSLNKSSYGHDTIEVRSTFESADWDDHVVELQPDPAFLARIARYSLSNPNDPGNQSALNWRGEERDLLADPAEMKTKLDGWQRVVFRGIEDRELRLEVAQPDGSYSFHHLGEHFWDRQARQRDGVWFCDYMKKSKDGLTWWWHDGALLMTETRKLPHSALDIPLTPIDQIDVISSRPVELRLEPISPTVDAWARAADLSWLGTGRKTKSWLFRMFPRTDEGLIVRTALAQDEDGHDLGWSRFLCRLRGDAQSSTADLEVDADEFRRAIQVDDRFDLDLGSRGLAFRAVTADGRPVPWVEASITALDDAEQIQKSRRALRAAGIDAGRQSQFLTGDLFGYWEDLETREPSLEAAEEALGAGLWSKLGDEETRRHVARSGSWYDSRKKIRGDDRGYGIDLRLDLEPGRRYQLWLWSRSRDAYEPDRVIQFIATEGVTDLGLIELEIHQP